MNIHKYNISQIQNISRALNKEKKISLYVRENVSIYILYAGKKSKHKPCICFFMSTLEQ
jgi:hypothetical protein